MRHVETKDGNNPIKAVMMQSITERAGIFHGYIYVATPMWYIRMLRDIEKHLAKHAVGFDLVCLNQLPAGSQIVNQIAQVFLACSCSFSQIKSLTNTLV